MNTSKVRFASVAALLLAATGAMARAPGTTLNLGPVMPSPGWGTTSTYNVYAAKSGRPIKNARVEFFFSGKKRLESTHYFGTTDADGRATFSEQIPGWWSGQHTWVNANAICLGVQRNWRVKK